MFWRRRPDWDTKELCARCGQRTRTKAWPEDCRAVTACPQCKEAMSWHLSRSVDASGETTTVYKVTRSKRVRGRTIYVSAVGRGWWEYPHRTEIDYTPDEPTTADAGKLFAFRSLEDAVAWAKELRSKLGDAPYVVWEAEARGVEPMSQVLAPCELLVPTPRTDLTWFCVFWCLSQEERKKLLDSPDVPAFYLQKAPPGTVACATITLRRRVAC